jgi:hypothetical protein
MNGVCFKDKQLRRLIAACKMLAVDSIVWTHEHKTGGNLFICGVVSILVMPAYLEDDARTEIKI